MVHSIEETTLWDEAATTSTRHQAEQLQQATGGPQGYRLRRVILTNFWLYDQQEFEIPHGRLFLAGENASGKSTVLIAAIPLALDGDIRPERIDTFGKREKRIDYYILGSNESATPFTRDSRTSYVALEFEWCAMDQPPFASELRAHWERGEYERARFLTIGLAFSGNKNNVNQVTATRFLITDGSRLGNAPGYNIPTVEKVKGETRAYDVKIFKKLLSGHGIICDTQRDYEQKVSQLLFNFSNVNDFRRLIKQLLYLRQPNLNSILSLASVRIYLQESLPQIPGDLIQQAAITIEQMDSLREELERRKKAYSATERLHLAQETLTVARVRLTACDYIHAQYQENEALGEVRRHKSNITRAENEFQRQQTRIDELQQEQDELRGKVSALEGSAGLQAAQKLNQISGRVKQLAESRSAQESILNDAIGRREQIYQNRELYAKDFRQLRQQSEEQLSSMCSRAAQQALWEMAAEQLQSTLQQVKALSLDAATPNVSPHISSLLETSSNERLQWLDSLRKLHRSAENETITLHAAQKHEADCYDEIDAATRQFENERTGLCTAQQNLADMLNAIIEESDIFPANYFTAIHNQAQFICNAPSSPQDVTTQFMAVVRDYSSALKNAIEQLQGSVSQLQRQLDTLRREQGAQINAVKLAQEAYQQKLQEPEFIPLRSEHRSLARKRLAEHNIPAIPLYMLIDFAPDLDNQSPAAGRIEYMLEDAGLLDALVVLPAHIEQADALLANEGLSDCRIDMERLLHVIKPEKQDAPVTTPDGKRQLLCVDAAMHETLGSQFSAWTESTQTILIGMERIVYTAMLNNATTTTGIWKHGLLTGLAGAGYARCIGKATRIREQQREQERLRQAWTALEQDLQRIVEQISLAEQAQQVRREIRLQLENAFSESSLAVQYSALQAALDVLNSAQERYTKARGATQKIYQHIQGIRASLLKECRDVDVFATDSLKVSQAYEQTTVLTSDYRELRARLERMLKEWQAYKHAYKQLEDAKAAEYRAASAYEKVERESRQAQAELTELQQVVQQQEGEDVNQLFSRLALLQKRLEELPDELQKAHDTGSKAEGSILAYKEGLDKAQITLEQTQQQRNTEYDAFLALLDSYPIEALLLARQMLAIKTPLETAQSFLDEPLQPQEEAYLATRLLLDQALSGASMAIFSTFSAVHNLLHDYRPEQNAQTGAVHFQNADNATPLQLLTRLVEEIQQQERLLDDKEKALFQDFLLKEMGDTIRKYIFEAQDWIDRMNNVLGHTSLIDEHYRLSWVTNPHDPNKPGSYLAQHHMLLQRQTQAFKDEEVASLVQAFRQEIALLRANQQDATGKPFADALAEIFDYRTWFHFEIYVTQADGQSQHLTDRLLKKRSGAEQYVALYVPFFAALSALYESAGKGAPRLIALDEAFDKVSVVNTRRLLKFLTAQQFQWIMTGPRITGEGTAIPACVRYLMLHQKGTELATGFASFWSNTQPAENE